MKQLIKLSFKYFVIILLLSLVFTLTGCGKQVDLKDTTKPIELGGTSTWGYTTAGSLGQWITADDLYCSVKFTSPSDIAGATISKMTMYAREDKSGDLYAKGVIVKASDKSIVAVGNAVLVPAAYAWIDSTFSSSPSLENSTDYYLCAIPDSGSMNLAIAYNNVVGFDEWRDTSNSYTTLTNPTDGELSGNTEEYSIYVTYTTGEEPPASTYCGHTGGDWIIKSDCYISSNTTTNGTIYLYETGHLYCIDGAVIQAQGIQGKKGTKIDAKKSCKLQFWDFK